MRSAAVSGDTDVRLMLADCEAPGYRFDEGFLKVKVTATHVTGTIDQERNVSGNGNLGYACTLENEIFRC